MILRILKILSIVFLTLILAIVLFVTLAYFGYLNKEVAFLAQRTLASKGIDFSPGDVEFGGGELTVKNLKFALDEKNEGSAQGVKINIELRFGGPVFKISVGEIILENENKEKFLSFGLGGVVGTSIYGKLKEADLSVKTFESFSGTSNLNFDCVIKDDCQIEQVGFKTLLCKYSPRLISIIVRISFNSL